MANPGPKWPTRIGTAGPLDRVAQIADRKHCRSEARRCPATQIFCRRRHQPRSRFTAGASAFFILSQSGEQPER